MTLRLFGLGIIHQSTKMDRFSPEQLEMLRREDHGPKIIALVISFTVLSFTFVVLRFFTRIRLTHLIGTEDYLVALSMLFSIATAATQIKQVQWAAGRHQIFVDPLSFNQSLKYLYWTLLTNVIAFTLIKVSICVQYHRIFSVTEARVPIYIVLGLCVTSGIAAVLSFAFTCTPPDAFWDLNKRPAAFCVNEHAQTYAMASINIATDLLVAALPVRAIWRLQLIRKQKIALIALMTLGWSVCIVSCLRLNALIVLAKNQEDSTFFVGPAIYWAAIEMNMAITCACIPALKPLLVRIIPDFTPRRSGPANTQPTVLSSRWSKLGRSFKKLEGSDGSAVNPANVKQDSVGTELGPVAALLPVHRPGSMRDHHIRVTHDIRQQSIHLFQPGTFLEDSDKESDTRRSVE